MKISVIIPSINAEKAKKTLLSIQNQQGVCADEIIIVGRNLGELIPADNSGIKVVNVYSWMNAAAARNLGAKSAKGDNLLFIDDDCEAAPNWVQANLAALSAGKNIGAVSGRLLGKSSRYFARCTDLAGFSKQLNEIRQERDRLKAASLGIRNKVFKDMNGFDEGLDIAEDVEFTKRLFQKGCKCIYCSEIVVYHDHRRDRLRKLISYMYQVARNYVKFLKLTVRVPLVVRVPIVIVKALRATQISLKRNRGVYRFRYLYFPGVFRYLEFAACRFNEKKY